MKNALLLCASHNDLGLIRALKRLGYNVIVIGNVPDLIGQKYADKYIQMDYSDKDKVLALAKEEKIDAIVQCCNDFGVYTASYVANELGLPGYDTYENTLILHNKDKFKEFAKNNNIMSPLSYGFDNEKEAKEFLKSVEYPQIIKPTDCSAGNGITRVDNYEGALEAVSYAFSKSRSGRIVIERFIQGTQHGFCTFLINQKVAAYCSNNEYSIKNPYRVEIDTYPASTDDNVSKVLIEQIERIASILKLKDGIFHLQYLMDGDKPQIIEVMRRILGNMYSVPASLLSGFDWDYWETRVRCGLDVKDFPAMLKPEGYYAYKTILAPSNGQIKDINISKRYDKYVIGNCMLKKPGDTIERYQSEPIGFLFMMFGSEEEMLNELIDKYDDSMVTMK